MLINYEPSMQYFNEWWKQLYGESEGKDFKGIYPSSANYIQLTFIQSICPRRTSFLI